MTVRPLPLAQPGGSGARDGLVAPAGSGRRRRRSAAGVVVALCLLFAWPAVVVAHGGTLLGSAVTGPYRTQLTGQLLPDGAPDGGRAFDLTAYVTDAASGADATVDVRTTIWLDGRPVRGAVHRIAGGYEAVVPVPDGATIGRQRIVVDVSGARGSGRLEIAPIEDGGPPTALFAITAVALAALVALALVARRRRPPADEDDADLA